MIIPTITETLPQSPVQRQREDVRDDRSDLHRSPTTKSNLSSYAFSTHHPSDGKNEERLRERSLERHADPLGLNVVYEPRDSTPLVDVILVHGLGGTSQKTWSRNRDTSLFWPGQWLPLEPGFNRVRILSFGYNAHFASSGRENILNTADFAKDLLFGMKYGLNEQSQELGIGKVRLPSHNLNW